MKINISGGMHVGKSTLAEGILKYFPFTRKISLATPLRETATNLGLPHTREVLQAIGHGMRELDEDVWVNLWLKEVAEYPGWNIICDDARYQNELDVADFVIRLDASYGAQWLRYQTSNKYDPEVTFEEWSVHLLHSTETAELHFPIAEEGTTNRDTLFINTEAKSAYEVLQIAVSWLSPRITKHHEILSPTDMRMKAINGNL